MPMSFTGMPSSPAMASAMPPFAVPSSFVRTIPSTGTASEKSLAWRRPFWPVVASTVSSVSCGALGHLLADDAADLAQLGHEVVLVVQPPGRVDDDDVGAALAAAGDGVERDRPGIGPLRAGDDLAAGALRPALELLDGGGAEGVGGAEHDVEAELALQVPGELADRRRLAGAVDADGHDHRRLVAHVDRARRLGGARSRPGARRAGSSAPRRPPARRPRPPARAGRRPARSSRAPTSAMISASSRRSQVSSSSVLEAASPGSRRRAPGCVLERFSRRRRKKPRRCSGSSSASAVAAAPRGVADEEVGPVAGHGRREDSGVDVNDSPDGDPPLPSRRAARQRPGRRDGRGDGAAVRAHRRPARPDRDARRDVAAARIVPRDLRGRRAGGRRRAEAPRRRCLRDQADVRRARGARRAAWPRRCSSRWRTRRAGSATRSRGWTPGRSSRTPSACTSRPATGRSATSTRTRSRASGARKTL